MKQTYYRILTAALICSLALCCFGTEAAAESGAAYILAQGNEQGITWILDSSGLLTICGNCAIPDYPSDMKKPWSPYRDDIKALVVENGVTGIGERAFYRFYNLETAVIGNDVAYIGECAFYSCTSLMSVTMPQYGIDIQYRAFRYTGVDLDVRANEISTYQGSEFCRRLQAVTLTGDYREDIINIAESQIGYHKGDSPAEYNGTNPDGTLDYSEYGRYLDTVGRTWCSEFSTWCVRMAGVPLDILASSRGANVVEYTTGTTAVYYAWDETCFSGGSYVPKKGDLVLLAPMDSNFTPEDYLSHTAILNEFDVNGTEIIFQVISGNCGNCVKRHSYKVVRDSGVVTNRNNQMIGYIISPAYESAVREYRIFQVMCLSLFSSLLPKMQEKPLLSW